MSNQDWKYTVAQSWFPSAETTRRPLSAAPEAAPSAWLRGEQGNGGQDAPSMASAQFQPEDPLSDDRPSAYGVAHSVSSAPQTRYAWGHTSTSLSRFPMAFSRVGALRSVKTLIAEGKALRTRKVASREALQAFRSDHLQWFDRVLQTLRTMYASERLIHDFSATSTRSYPCGVPSIAAETKMARRELDVSVQRLKQVARAVTMALEVGESGIEEDPRISLLQSLPFRPSQVSRAGRDLVEQGLCRGFPASDREKPDKKTPSWWEPASSLEVRSPNGNVRPGPQFEGSYVVHAAKPDDDRALTTVLREINARYLWCEASKPATVDGSLEMRLGAMRPRFVLLVESSGPDHAAPRNTEGPTAAFHGAAWPNGDAPRRHTSAEVTSMLERLVAAAGEFVPRQVVVLGHSAMSEACLGRVHFVYRDGEGVWKSLLARHMREAGLSVDLHGND